MARLKTFMMAGLGLVYVVVAVLFAFGSSRLDGLAGVTGNMIANVPYMPGWASNSALVLPLILILVSIVVFIVYLRADD